jgi:transcriptional regulator with XRE-family HTH domain
MSEQLGERIRRTRIAYGMSQAELARRIGVSANTMNKIEAGETPDPRVSRIKGIADALRVSTDYLLGREETLPPGPPQQRQRPRKAAPVA